MLDLYQQAIKLSIKISNITIDHTHNNVCQLLPNCRCPMFIPRRMQSDIRSKWHNRNKTQIRLIQLNKTLHLHRLILLPHLKNNPHHKQHPNNPNPLLDQLPRISVTQLTNIKAMVIIEFEIWQKHSIIPIWIEKWGNY